MKVYEMLGGGQVMGTTNFELVEMMRKTSHTPTEDIYEFMQQTAKRCKMQRGSEIRVDSVDNFLDDLKENGFVKEI